PSRHHYDAFKFLRGRSPAQFVLIKKGAFPAKGCCAGLESKAARASDSRGAPCSFCERGAFRLADVTTPEPPSEIASGLQRGTRPPLPARRAPQSGAAFHFHTPRPPFCPSPRTLYSEFRYQLELPARENCPWPCHRA